MAEKIDLGRPAATVVIVRDMPGALPEILMMERAKSMAFAGGALVFPGGAVDEGDLYLADALRGALDRDEAAARIAAVRETLEESGLGIGLSRPVEQAELMAMRLALGEGVRMGEVLDRHGVALALDSLVPFARWHPVAPEKVSKIYDTRFYLTRAPEGQEASVDATENVSLFWSGAAATLERCDAGEGRVIFPTRRNLERLALYPCFDALAAHAVSIPVEKIQPWFEERDGEPHLCIPTHLGYPVTSEPVATLRRGWVAP